VCVCQAKAAFQLPEAKTSLLFSTTVVALSFFPI